MAHLEFCDALVGLYLFAEHFCPLELACARLYHVVAEACMCVNTKYLLYFEKSCGSILNNCAAVGYRKKFHMSYGRSSQTVNSGHSSGHNDIN